MATSDLKDKDTLQRVHQFRFSVELFDRNHAELSLFLQYLSSPLVSLQIATPPERWRQKEALHEVQFLLHNFVASAMSLVDHTRAFYKELYSPRALIPDYQAQIDKRFVNDPLSQFLKGLRQMAQHYRLPSITITRRLQGGSEGGAMETSLTLAKTDLERFSSWSAAARAYLADSPSAIEIGAVVDAYAKHVADFYNWFGSQQDKLHGKAAAIWTHLVTRGIAFPEQEVVATIERNVEELEKQPKESLTFETVRDALSPALTLLDQRQLMYCIYDPALWRDHAISRIRKRFTLPAPLLVRVHAIFERDA